MVQLQERRFNSFDEYLIYDDGSVSNVALVIKDNLNKYPEVLLP